MNGTKADAKKSFAVIVLFMLAIGGAAGAGIVWVLKRAALLFAPGSDGVLTIPELNTSMIIQSLADLSRLSDMAATRHIAYIFLFTTLVFLILGLMLWGVLKLSGALSGAGTRTPRGGTKKGRDSSRGEKGKGKDFVDKRVEQDRQRRLFLHFISVLQREGRLLDFFAEELSDYDDDQIGAAVRSIQEDCKQSVNKYLSPVPVIDREEGDRVDVEPGFDPNAIKLTGDVSGEPPFKGILRHRGWKAAKNEVPKLSDVQDAAIIAPAEVEIE